MDQIEAEDILDFVKSHLDDLNQRRLDGLNSLTMPMLFENENPYTLKTKGIISAGTLVKLLLDKHLSMLLEEIFVDFIRGLAVFICGRIFNGKKSLLEGLDLEFERDGVQYIVTIKSGPNWGNSRQIEHMVDNFKKAKRILRTSKPTANICAINGCYYGRDNQPDKGDYLKLCGQKFWELISANTHMYIDIVAPLSICQERNAAFADEYDRILGVFSHQFYEDFYQDGRLDWEKLVKYNSGAK